MLGEYWVVSEVEGSFMGMPFSSVFTLGYDPGKEKFVGTWIDSLSSNFWHYEGTLSADGKTLTLVKQDPCGGTPGKSAVLEDVMEIQSRDQKTLTSRALVDGEWRTMLTIRSRRKA